MRAASSVGIGSGTEQRRAASSVLGFDTYTHRRGWGRTPASAHHDLEKARDSLSERSVRWCGGNAAVMERTQSLKAATENFTAHRHEEDTTFEG